jgi:SAM-dependent methyltransferase
MQDTWADGDAYEAYIGRWSRLVAAEFVRWLDAPRGGRWLDVGCGTGALTEAVLAGADPESVTGVDPAPAYLGRARALIPDPRATFEPGSAQSLPMPSEAFDAVGSGLVLNFVPDPVKAMREFVRVARPGGIIAVYVWDYAEGMQMLRAFWDAAVGLDPAAKPLDEGTRFPLCRRDALESCLEAAGLAGIQTRAIEVPTAFDDFDDYWAPFLGGQGPAPTYLASLPDGRREQLHERLRDALAPSSDGSVRLTARAWAARGMRR